MHLQACFANLGYQVGDFPESEAAANETLAISIYPELTEEMQQYLVEIIIQFYRCCAGWMLPGSTPIV